MSASEKGRGAIVAPCRIEIGNTAEFLYAHVEIDDVEIGPGDRVLVSDAPGLVAFGQCETFTRSATIIKANWLERMTARLQGYLELAELYEVGFSDGGTP